LSWAPVLEIANTGKLVSKPSVEEDNFRWLMNEDAMATEKLAHGIRNFAIDPLKLEGVLSI